MNGSNGVEAAYLQVGGSLAFVEQSGAGIPVLCLHTAGQSGVQWRTSPVSWLHWATAPWCRTCPVTVGPNPLSVGRSPISGSTRRGASS